MVINYDIHMKDVDAQELLLN